MQNLKDQIEVTITPTSSLSAVVETGVSFKTGTFLWALEQVALGHDVTSKSLGNLMYLTLSLSQETMQATDWEIYNKVTEHTEPRKPVQMTSDPYVPKDTVYLTNYKDLTPDHFIYGTSATRYVFSDDLKYAEPKKYETEDVPYGMSYAQYLLEKNVNNEVVAHEATAKCECGGDKLRLPHSHWCAKHPGE